MFDTLIKTHSLCMMKDIFSIDELTYFYILPNNNLIHIFQYLANQNKGKYSLYNIYL